MKIIRYNKTADITIEFQDLYKYQTDTFYQNFKIGQIKNPYDRSVSGVGYIGEGNYKAKENDKLTSIYVTWRDMIYRCYDEKNRHLHPSYAKNYVCDRWHNYQTFAKWYDDNFYQVGEERMHLDKDILYKNNTIYSPETCLIVPQRINMIFMKRSNKDNLPNGIRFVSEGKISAKYNTDNLGIFNTIEQAMTHYNSAKQIHIRKVADEYRDYIPIKLYNALYSWIPDSAIKVM